MAAGTMALTLGVGDKEKAINPWLIAITVTLATFMELLDTAIANVSLPHIAGGLAAFLWLSQLPELPGAIATSF